MKGTVAGKVIVHRFKRELILSLPRRALHEVVFDFLEQSLIRRRIIYR